MKKFRLQLKKHLSLLRISITYSFQQDTAFLFNNWSNILSTIFFTISWVLMINIIYSNTDSLAGYSKDEMLMFALISQIVFYCVYSLGLPNIRDLISSVNSGALDLLLTKPAPSLFYVMTRKLNLLSVLRDGSIPLIFIAASINYNNLQISPESLLVGIIVMCLGILSTYIIVFIAALPVFWLGQSEAVLDLVASAGFDALGDIPYEGFSVIPALQGILTWVVPFLVADAIAASVILGKIPILNGLIVAVVTTLVFILIVKYIWQFALKSYSSASS